MDDSIKCFGCGKVVTDCRKRADGYQVVKCPWCGQWFEYYEPLDTTFYYTQDDPTCPWCGAKQNDSWEWIEDYGREVCDTCGRRYLYERETTITFATERTFYKDDE